MRRLIDGRERCHIIPSWLEFVISAAGEQAEATLHTYVSSSGMEAPTKQYTVIHPQDDTTTPLLFVSFMLDHLIWAVSDGFSRNDAR